MTKMQLVAEADKWPDFKAQQCRVQELVESYDDRYKMVFLPKFHCGMGAVCAFGASERAIVAVEGPRDIAFCVEAFVCSELLWLWLLRLAAGCWRGPCAELNPIELLWGATKRRLRNKLDGTLKTLREQLPVTLADTGSSMDYVQGWFLHVQRYVNAYSEGEPETTLGEAYKAVRKSHRCSTTKTDVLFGAGARVPNPEDDSDVDDLDLKSVEGGDEEEDDDDAGAEEMKGGDSDDADEESAASDGDSEGDERAASGGDEEASDDDDLPELSDFESDDE